MRNSPVPPDSASAVSCTRADAVAGSAVAQFGVAFCLAAGAAPQDYVQAAQWYFKAADQNHRLAQFNLGQMFAHGQGVEQNDSMAAMWIRRAANGGDPGAQFDLGDRLGRASVRGSGTEARELRIEAYKWFKLAAAQGYRDALNRSDSATVSMTREEVTEGNCRVNSFVMT
ncbi:MAG TPA: tetratricopeptide repeat protein [Methylomirabilota bacterium]|nr:tetratricopeptide repeat protein [Methylomirabilota bacterium]